MAVDAYHTSDFVDPYPSALYFKKVSTFELSVTFSTPNRLSKFLHCWKAYEICYKTRMT